jgi:hypothetical protein
VRALGAGARQPGLAQHAEVVRARRLGDAELERAAACLALRGERPHDLHAHGVAERGHQAGQGDLVGVRMVDGLHVR